MQQLDLGKLEICTRLVHLHVAITATSSAAAGKWRLSVAFRETLSEPVPESLHSATQHQMMGLTGW